MDKFELLSIRETTSEDWRTCAKAAFEHWETQSNGLVEARKFAISPSLDSSDLWQPLFLRKLNLDCLKNALSHQIEMSKELDIEDFVSRFCQAADSSAYGRFLSDEAKQAAVWKSLSALMTQTEDTPIDFLRSEIEGFFWYEFYAESPWFYPDWKVGFMALRGDGQVLTMIAATDTD